MAKMLGFVSLDKYKHCFLQNEGPASINASSKELSFPALSVSTCVGFKCCALSPLVSGEITSTDNNVAAPVVDASAAISAPAVN